jgi:BirA family biotin operon repressor/biotin-[acetyl-CoA-carboxylase] ligase
VESPSEEWQLATGCIGRRVLVFDEVDSTNSVAARLDAAEGTVVLARNQTAGRGRFGRVWRSRPGAAILMSVLLRPPPELRRPSVLTAWAAVGVSDAIAALTGRTARIKWPNDLLMDDKKVCGILIEQGAATIVGIGLNSNQTAEEFAAAGLPLASSLTALSGKSFELRPAAEAVLAHLDAAYSQLTSGNRAAVEATWQARTGFVDQCVEVELSDGQRIVGRIREMNFAGIELEDVHGRLESIVPERIEQIRLSSDHCADRRQ